MKPTRIETPSPVVKATATSIEYVKQVLCFVIIFNENYFSKQVCPMKSCSGMSNCGCLVLLCVKLIRDYNQIYTTKDFIGDTQHLQLHLEAYWESVQLVQK